MPKSKAHNDDLFLRGYQVRSLHAGLPGMLEAEAGRARAGNYLEALVAAVAVIAHADGHLDLNERRKLIESFLASSASEGFSVAELAEELADHMRAYSYDPQIAEERALASLRLLGLKEADRRAIRDTCHKVIIADGLVHPAELGALHRIDLAFGIEEAGR